MALGARGTSDRPVGGGSATPLSSFQEFKLLFEHKLRELKLLLAQHIREIEEIQSLFRKLDRLIDEAEPSCKELVRLKVKAAKRQILEKARADLGEA